MKIARIMSTQHPDNVNSPFFAKDPVLAGDDEILETFYTYSHLNIDEQLWDAEGKEVDNYVVEKLLSRYPSYFEKNKLGKDKFLTLRVPNPEVEKGQAKIVLESMNSISRSYDLAKMFYKDEEIAPILEVFLPQCTSEKGITRIHEYYKRSIIEQKRPIRENDISLSEWLGKFGPEDIRVTPLFETKDAIINASNYVEKYINSQKIENLQRVWFARSDPALNYGSTACVLIEKIGLSKLQILQEKLSMDILPILGCGSAPFRGNFKPTNVKEMMKAYPSVQTFTAQSAFKYDYPIKKVLEGTDLINTTKRKAPIQVEESDYLNLIDKMEAEYIDSVKLLVPMIDIISKFIPKRRKRKLHIGLFGYSRNTEGLVLPRAITFCASLYSIGLPPDILGLSALSEKEIDKIRQVYRSIDEDLADAFQYFNKDNLKYLPIEIQSKVNNILSKFDFEVDENHKTITTSIMESIRKRDFTNIEENILKAGNIRNFLG